MSFFSPLFRIENYAERRKQVIQASKYLGGDMEHTHLVKGLDFALLEKVCGFFFSFWSLEFVDFSSSLIIVI